MMNGKKAHNTAAWLPLRILGRREAPSAEIADCTQFVESRTAASIIRRALAAGTMDTDIQTAANSAATAAAAASAI